MKSVVIAAIDKINGVLEKISVSMMIFLLFLTFANVVGRYLFQRSIFFADELARFIFVWVVFLGIAKIVKDKRQVAVSLLTDKLQGTVPGYVLEAIIAFCGLVFLVIVFIGGVQLSSKMNVYSSAALGIPMGYVYMAVPVGIGLTLVFHVLNFIELVMEFLSRKEKVTGGVQK